MSVIVVMLRMLDQAAGRVPASSASISDVIEASASLHQGNPIVRLASHKHVQGCMITQRQNIA